jgi:hypothetical protein
MHMTKRKRNKYRGGEGYEQDSMQPYPPPANWLDTLKAKTKVFTSKIAQQANQALTGVSSKIAGVFQDALPQKAAVQSPFQHSIMGKKEENKISYVDNPLLQQRKSSGITPRMSHSPLRLKPSVRRASSASRLYGVAPTGVPPTPPPSGPIPPFIEQPVPPAPAVQQPMNANTNVMGANTNMNVMGTNTNVMGINANVMGTNTNATGTNTNAGIGNQPLAPKMGGRRRGRGKKGKKTQKEKTQKKYKRVCSSKKGKRKTLRKKR